MTNVPKAKEGLKVVTAGKEKSEDIYNIINERQTAELVIAFCGPLGSGTSTVAEQFKKAIQDYKYETLYLKTSDQIINHLNLVPEIGQISSKDSFERIKKCQDAGNALREKYENNILSQFLIQEIAIDRRRRDKKSGDEEKLGKSIAESRRHITIVDSLKHPDEVKLLKAVYGNMFYLFAVLCPEQIMKTRLNTNKHIKRGKEVILMERDKSEEKGFGQQLLETLHYADFFIRNDDVNVTMLRKKLKRYINLILGNSFITPTIDEYAMYCAQSAALKSACLSRQVGASIISENGDLISTGCNEVPKCGGGHYSTDDEGADGRCMNMFGQKCHNQMYKKEILQSINEIIKESEKEIGNDNLLKISDQLSKHDRIKNLLEFSRSVHAEMDAIINVARLGNGSLKNASLYCTTFPCHNCARHIIVSGIRKVYYIEPYEKSLARELHGDAIEFDSKITNKPIDKVVFVPFEGVAPKQYINLFMADERKADGKRIEQDLSVSKPRVRQYLDNHVNYESRVVQYIEDTIK